jgi:hypothetical protein
MKGEKLKIIAGIVSESRYLDLYSTPEPHKNEVGPIFRSGHIAPCER